MRVYDMHCHAHEFPLEELSQIVEEFPGDLVVVAVSEDLESLYKTLEYAQTLNGNLIPCAGLHPWSIGEVTLQEAYEIARAAERLGLNCIGEVGLDRKFVDPTTYKVQEEVFRLFLRTARELDAYVTIHSPKAWARALTMLVEEGVEKAMFHWYTGPLNLIDEIIASGYYISINPAIKIQEKHRRVAEHTPLRGMVLESDGPYNYRGLRLNPLMIPEAAEFVARLKGVAREEVLEAAGQNSARLLGL
ncbi:MAG: TatD family hydrolase [Desulfurococcales archaeon]|nr:TatD family hydrolase [Desulfurococcales archaeon]